MPNATPNATQNRAGDGGAEKRTAGDGHVLAVLAVLVHDLVHVGLALDNEADNLGRKEGAQSEACERRVMHSRAAKRGVPDRGWRP